MTTELMAAIPDAAPRLVGEDSLVSDLVHDSRDVRPGAGFVAISGAVTDGHKYAATACAAAASVVVVDHQLEVGCTQLIVDDTRLRMARLAATVQRNPATELTMVGVTGTNGKTTVTHMLEAIVTAAGRIPGIVGTVGAHIAGEVVPQARTTPEATDLHRLLRRMVTQGVSVAALEVSSHALELGRADAIVFDVAAFTNLSQDHLDFHQDMEAYFRAKAKLFAPERARHAVLWVDDAAGSRLAAMTDVPKTTVGFGPAGTHDVSGEFVSWAADVTRLMMHTPTESIELEIPLAGRFNAANALIAGAVACRLGLAIDATASGLRALRPVPGRYERIPNNLGFSVVVDYAHTPDAVALSIGAAQEVTSGRVIAVVGSAGDRDPAKRVPMGRAAATADIAIITSDNPRSEDPQTLVQQVVAGAGGPSEAVFSEVDRRAAIRHALRVAERGDIVLILGKGHETYQEFATETIHFDDREVAREELAALGGVAP